MTNQNETTFRHYDKTEMLQVFEQAFHDTVETQLQPIKINCTPRFNEEKDAVKFIEQLFKEIENDFRKQN